MLLLCFDSSNESNNALKKNVMRKNEAQLLKCRAFSAIKYLKKAECKWIYASKLMQLD